MTAIRLLDLGLTHWLHTQAVYHALAEVMGAETPDTIIVAQPIEPYLCIGYHQELASVLDQAACAQMGLPIVRRRVGGGATYLDANQLFYQCIFHHTRVPATVNQVYARLLEAPVATLRSLGLQAELRGENEVEVGGSRIAGIGGGRIGEAAVVVGNLLFDFDYNAMDRAWRTPCESFRRLAAEALRERVTTLRAELSQPVSPAVVKSILLAEFARALGRPLERGEPTPAELWKIDELEERLVSEEWLNLHATGARPMRELKIARGVFIQSAVAEVDNYHVRASFRVRDGLIERAALESEPEREWREVEEMLRGTGMAHWVTSMLDAGD
jgi:lipoate-protein ligase A